MCNVMWPCNTMIWTGCSDKSLINISLISTDSVWYKLAKKRSRRTPPIISLLHSSRVAFHSACRSSVSYILADLRHQVTLFCSIHAVALVCIWKISVIFLDQPNGQLFLKLGRKKKTSTLSTTIDHLIHKTQCQACALYKPYYYYY